MCKVGHSLGRSNYPPSHLVLPVCNFLQLFLVIRGANIAVMGQRHQLFVIACINGRYRCLAAVHHQWLFGRNAAERCLEILKLLNSNLNRIALQEELKLAKTYSAEFWERGERIDYSDAGHVPRFPFITTCLCIGAGFDQSCGYHRKVHVEPWLMGYNEGDNNNGEP